MADVIQVHYASMAAGSAAMRTATGGIRTELQRLVDAKNKVGESWSAESKAAFDLRCQTVLNRCDDIDSCITGHANLIDEVSQVTSQIDTKMAALFGEGA